MCGRAVNGALCRTFEPLAICVVSVSEFRVLLRAWYGIREKRFGDYSENVPGDAAQ